MTPSVPLSMIEAMTVHTKTQVYDIENCTQNITDIKPIGEVDADRAALLLTCIVMIPALILLTLFVPN